MQRLLLTLALQSTIAGALYGQDEGRQIVRRLPSPGHLYTATYKGTDYGDGVVSISSLKGQIPLFNTDSNHVPSFKWLNKTALSIRVHCGSPCWYERFYDTEAKTLSPEFQFTLASSPESKLVVHVSPEDEILVSEMYSGKTRLRYRPKFSECQEFVFLYIIKFIDPSTISVKCSNKSVVLQIPSQPIPNSSPTPNP